jgi:hypothetical protein
MFVQSHTPFADLDEYKDKTVLVVGGDGDSCRAVAETSVRLYNIRAVEYAADNLSDMALTP